MKKHYKVIFETQEEGGYTVTIPALPGCISEGDSFDEALVNIKEAMTLYIESLKADGLPAPEENNLFLEKVDQLKGLSSSLFPSLSISIFFQLDNLPVWD